MKKKKSGEHGKFLVIMLLLSVIFQAITTQSLMQELIEPFVLQSLLSHSQPIIVEGFFLELWKIFFLVSLPFIFTGIWQWDKLAVYASILFISTNIILSSILLYGIFFLKTYHPVVSFIPYFVTPYILSTFFLFWAIKRKWHLFR